MAYKTRFRPIERLGRSGWRRMDEANPGDEGDGPIALPFPHQRKRLLIPTK
jgi:hypothetical protein